jgi:hypothetical protein
MVARRCDPIRKEWALMSILDTRSVLSVLRWISQASRSGVRSGWRLGARSYSCLGRENTSLPIATLSPSCWDFSSVCLTSYNPCPALFLGLHWSPVPTVLPVLPTSLLWGPTMVNIVIGLDLGFGDRDTGNSVGLLEIIPTVVWGR